MEELLRINQLWERILRKEAEPEMQILYKLEFCELLLSEFSGYTEVDLEKFSKNELLFTHLTLVNSISNLNANFYEKLLSLIPENDNADPFVDKTRKLEEKNKELSTVLQQRAVELANIIKSQEQLEKFEKDLQNVANFIQAIENLKEVLNEEMKQSIQALNILTPETIENKTAIKSSFGITIVSNGLFGKKIKLIMPIGSNIDGNMENQVVKHIKLFNEVNLKKLFLKLQFDGNKCFEIPLSLIFPNTNKTNVSVSYAFIENWLQLAIGNEDQNIDTRRVLNIAENSESIIKQILNYGSK